jgi:hypothetical protein
MWSILTSFSQSALGILRGMARFWGDFADAEICDACGKPITKQQWITEGIASTLSDRRPVQFHVGCFQFWDTEKRRTEDALAGYEASPDHRDPIPSS